MTGADAAEPGRASSLHLEVTRDGEFEVLSSRSKDHGVSQLFGLIGVGIVSASRSASDGEREKAVAPDGDPALCRNGFERALSDHLEDNGFRIYVDRSDQLPSLEIEIVACGFRVVKRPKGEMAAFFDAEYRFTKAGAQRAKKQRRLFQVGEYRGAWTDFEQSPAFAAEEFQQVLEHAGRKLANRIVYSRGS